MPNILFQLPSKDLHSYNCQHVDNDAQDQGEVTKLSYAAGDSS